MNSDMFEARGFFAVGGPANGQIIKINRGYGPVFVHTARNGSRADRRMLDIGKITPIEWDRHEYRLETVRVGLYGVAELTICALVSEDITDGDQIRRAVFAMFFSHLLTANAQQICTPMAIAGEVGG